jgi:transposase-like protein
VKVGEFCPNEACPDYQKLQDGRTERNIIKAGKSRKGVQRYECKTCGKSFTQTKGTLFYKKRTVESEILETLALLVEGSRISSLSRVKGHKEDTILSWLREAAEHTQAVEEVLMKDYRVERGQLDGLWAYVRNKGEKRHLGTSFSCHSCNASSSNRLFGMFLA